MLPWLRNILLWISFSLLLLHSFVPHHHVDHRDCQQTHVEEAETLENPLSFLFETQLGEGHLEHFFSEGTLALHIADFCAPDRLLFASAPFQNLLDPKPNEGVLVFPFSSIFEYQKPLRAPPFLA